MAWRHGRAVSALCIPISICVCVCSPFSIPLAYVLHKNMRTFSTNPPLGVHCWYTMFRPSSDSVGLHILCQPTPCWHYFYACMYIYALGLCLLFLLTSPPHTAVTSQKMLPPSPSPWQNILPPIPPATMPALTLHYCYTHIEPLFSSYMSSMLYICLFLLYSLSYYD